MKKKLTCTRPLRLSWHARNQSLPRRSVLSPQEVLSILDKGLTIPIGNDGKKYSELFFSIKDNYWFVVIINRNINEIITFLPIEYNRWKISDDVQEAARQIAYSGNPQVPIPGNYTDNNKGVLKTFIVLDNGHDQKLPPDCWPKEYTITSISIFWSDEKSRRLIREEIIKANIPLDRITAVEARNKAGFKSEAPEDTLNQILWP